MNKIVKVSLQYFATATIARFSNHRRSTKTQFKEFNSNSV